MQFSYGLWGKCMQNSLKRSAHISMKLNDDEKFTAML